MSDDTPTEEIKPTQGNVTKKVIKIGGSEWTVRELIQLVAIVLTFFGITAKAVGDTQYTATAESQKQIEEKIDALGNQNDKLNDKVDGISEDVGEVKHKQDLQGKDLEALKTQQDGNADAIRRLQGDVDELKKRE
mgnify:CR=1 FL=1